MNWKKAVWIGVAAVVALLVLFEIGFRVEFSLPGESSQLNAAQEARYAACYAERDNEIHDVAFGTIDNPDVQKLYILNNRKRAATECRQRFPEQWTVIEVPFRFNLIDLQFRY
jgi:hypothetical protein